MSSFPHGPWGRLLVFVFVACGATMVGHTAQATETTTYVLTDAQGTVLAREDAHGTTIATYDYRPYGKQQTGPTTAGPGYTGHVDDSDTGLVYMQARYYDPQMARFLSVDGHRGAPGDIFKFGRYVYANNDPINHIDPNGFDSQVMLGAYFLGLPFAPNAMHQFVYIQDLDTSATYVARGGPDDSNAIGSGSSALTFEASGAGTAKSNQWLSLAPEAVNLVGQLDNGSDSSDLKHHSIQVPGSVTTVKGPTGELLKTIEGFNGKLNGAKVPYLPLSTNSNSYAATVYQLITGMKAPVNEAIPGGDHDLRDDIEKREKEPEEE